MAAERKPFFLFRPRFVLTCFYVAAYVCLRNYGEIALQTVALPGPHGQQVFRMVGASPELPYWRQQLWRALFSLPMVVEEEGRKVEEKGRGYYRDAQGGVAEGRRIIDEGQRAMQQFIPQQQQQQPQQQQRWQ